MSEKSAFEKKYEKVLEELDCLYKGTFSESEGPGAAALCLLAMNDLVREVGEAEFSARAAKREIDFAKAEAYEALKGTTIEGKKLAEAALAVLILKDNKVMEASKKYNEAERQSKDLSNFYGLLKEAHITFRGIKKI